MKARLLGIGVATLDIYSDQRRIYPGGNEYNVAYNAAILGADAGFLGVFGNDKAGRILEDTLLNAGIHTDYSHHEEGSSGYCLVRIKEDGDREFLFWNQEGVTDLYPIQFTKEELDYVKTYDVVCIGRLADVSQDRIQFLAENGVSLCYDFHASYQIEDVERVAPYIDYAFFSCSHLSMEEIRLLLKRACDLGAKLAVGTRGSESVIAYDGKNYYEQETFKVDPIDALGAGDSYIAGVMVNYIESKDIQKSLENAARHSAHVVMIEGSIGIGYDMGDDRIEDIVNL